jgi:hypothetical protein
LLCALIPADGGNMAGLKSLAKAAVNRLGFDEMASGLVNNFDEFMGKNPQYLGAAPDRSNVSYLRYMPAKNTPRVDAALAALRDPENPYRKRMIDTISRGQKIGGDDWYNTEALRDMFVAELGEEAGDAEWRDFMHLMGTTSPGSKVYANIGNASAVRRRMAGDQMMPDSNMTFRENDPTGFGSGDSGQAYIDRLMNIEKAQDVGDLTATREKGYGHLTGRNQELNNARYVQGLYSGAPEPGVSGTNSSMTQNPKPKGFINSLLGNQRNIAADLHFTRLIGMASQDPRWLGNAGDVSAEFKQQVLSKYPEAAEYFGSRTDRTGKTHITFRPKQAVQDGVVDMKDIEDYPSVWSEKPNDAEYGPLEAYIGELSKELNMTPAQLQANLWMGAAPETGVDQTSADTFMRIFMERVKDRAAKDNTTPEATLKNFIRNKGLLAVPTGAIGVGAMGAGGEDDIEAFLRENGA